MRPPYFLIVAGVLAATHALRINCGGPTVGGGAIVADDPKWSWSNTRVRFFRVANAFTKGVPFSHAWTNGGDLVYRFKVNPTATVTVIARFAETYKPGFRRDFRKFRLWINGMPISHKGQFDIDVFANAGAWNSLILRRSNFVPKDGIISVHVRSVKQNAMISGVDVYQSTGRVVPVPASIPVYLPYVNPPIGNPPTTNNPVVNPPTTENPVVNPPAPNQNPALVGSGSWRTVDVEGGTLPRKRHEACSVMAGGKVYLIGGRRINPVSVFDPKTRRWVNKKNTPVELHHMQCVAWKDRYIYVAGAWYGPFPRELAHEHTYVYDTVTDTWAKELPPPVARRRGGGALVLYKNKLYLGMGNQGGHGEHATSVGWLDVYDLNNKAAGWKPLATAPDARDHVAGGVVGGHYFCIVGGRDGGTANFWGSPETRTNCYNVNTDSWERRARMPVGRAGANTGVTCQGLIMVAGGEGRAEGVRTGGRAYDRVDLYDFKTDSFRNPSFLKRGRHGTGLAVSDCSCGNIYLPSGSGGLGGGPELTSTEVWSPDGVARNC